MTWRRDVAVAQLGEQRSGECEWKELTKGTMDKLTQRE